ncbi:MAG: multiprotein bridging factor aMBF1, partial [Candidatus Nanohaloarchaea archaeon]|nr:multiprotein bridging factor aMBF1 [Candidatus Nanohaloarchaea archaeon]
ITMATCEMCGDAGDLKKTKVEGTTLKLCEDCQGLGEVVERSTTTRSRTTQRAPSTPDEDVLPGYGRKVKQAREQRDLTVEELAGTLKEKESVVRRVESEKLTPDRNLARKFEKELGIDIYGTPPEEPETSTDDDGGRQTLGDVAEVKEG